ncbi:MAG: A/G-specific adenine glycosylase [Clostridia bacterium]|nr:A/G-specific adenine glycosylase [Clostridia bacterium]
MEKQLPVWMASPLLEWYDENRRSLPWRETKDPYRIWVSEIMLQQTRVEKVKEYYARFLSEFPNVESLANAEEGRVLKCWEGLGYYSRARNLMAGARQVLEEYGGHIPSERDLLRKIRGIGDYTSGAIAAFAFDRREPAVDGNVLRVVARLTASEDDVLSGPFKRMAEQLLRDRIPEDRPGDFGQALIELGALVCIPGTPRCGVCPLRGMCESRVRGMENILPVRKKPEGKKTERYTVLVLSAREKTALVRRREGELLAGMYGFPTVPEERTEEEILRSLQKQGACVLRTESLGEARHVFTHRIWEMKGLFVLLKEKIPGEDWIWAFREEIRTVYPVPKAFSRYLSFVLSGREGDEDGPETQRKKDSE